MLKRNWRAILTIVGITALTFAAIGLFSALTWHSTALENEATNRSNIHRQYAHDRIEWVCPTLISPPDCIAEANQATRENEREEQDLAAQKITAWWTKVMGIAALIGMALSAVGVWLVKTTFDETRKSNEITKAAQRAWIAAQIKPLNIAPTDTDEIEIWLEIIIKNEGQMAAKGISAAIRAMPQSFENHRPAELRKVRSIADVTNALPPNGTETLQAKAKFPIREVSWLSQFKKYRAIITLVIAYSDGETIETWVVGERRRDDPLANRTWDISIDSTLTENGISWKPYKGRSYT